MNMLLIKSRFRPTNLFIVFVIQLLFYVLFIRKHLQDNHNAIPSDLFFLGTNLLTVLITIGGYIINDIVDVDIDRINKPKQAIENIAFWKNVYTSTILIGVSTTLLLSYLQETILYVFIYCISVYSLYLYSVKLKCTTLLGNIVVALFSAGSVLILLLTATAYIPLRQLPYEILVPILIFGYFSFSLSLIREMVKDIEDINGDKKMNCNTLSVRFGKKKAKTTLVCISLLFLILNVLICFINPKYLTQAWLIFFLAHSMFITTIMILTIRAKQKKHFSFVSRLTKIMMFIGLILLLII